MWGNFKNILNSSWLYDRFFQWIQSPSFVFVLQGQGPLGSPLILDPGAGIERLVCQVKDIDIVQNQRSRTWVKITMTSWQKSYWQGSGFSQKMKLCRKIPKCLPLRQRCPGLLLFVSPVKQTRYSQSDSVLISCCLTNWRKIRYPSDYSALPSACSN